MNGRIPYTALTIEKRVSFHTGRRGRLEIRDGNNAPPQPDEAAVPHRVPRVAKLLALAIRFQRLIDSGAVESRAELGRLGHVSRARISQILDLTLLAPDIQEDILFMPPVKRGRDPITERDLRPIVRELDWEKQRYMWKTC